MYPTLVVNLFGGPGTGKSTNAALVFGKLKARGLKCELVTEFAKDLTWEGRGAALSFQPYVTAKQLFRLHRVVGQVEVVITDSPILLGIIYRGQGYSVSFETFVLDTFRLYNNANFFLERNSEHHPYVAEGRNQTELDATLKDLAIRDMLEAHQIPYTPVPILEGERTADELVRRIISHLEERS